MRTLLLLFLVTVSSASAQSYSVTAHVIAGGGGTSSGGNYAVTGTLAQHEANPASTGGSYSMSGGFLVQYMALQQIGAPHVTIRGVGAYIQVSWGSNVPGWVLQSNNSNLNPNGWVDVMGTPTVSGGEQFLQFTPGSERVFFRLRKL